jgi:type II secretory pathway component PulF
MQTAASGLKGKLPRAFLEMKEIIARGDSLAGAMAHFPKRFDSLDIMIIDSGETAGYLPETIKELGEWYAFRDHMRKIIISGLALPVCILHLAAVLVPLPFFFLGKIDLTGFAIQTIGILAMFYIPAVVLWAVFRFTPKTGLLRRLLDGLIMKIPIVRRGVLHLSLSRYSRTFHMLLKAGVPAIQCAEKAAEVVGNAVVRNSLAGAARSVREGKLFSEGFSKRLPFDFRESWHVGEETGDLDRVTERLARAQADTAEFIFKEVSRWFPRIVYFLLLIYMALQVLRGYGALYNF